MKIKGVLFVRDLGDNYSFTSTGVIVYGVMEDNSQVELFNFCSNELSFSSKELIGLTVEEARELKVKKDIAYLRGE